MKATPQSRGRTADPSLTRVQSARDGVRRMSIRNVAREAYEASQSDRVTAARDAMVALLGDPDAEFSTMTLAEVQSPPQVPYTLVIFADDDSDVVPTYDIGGKET